MLGASNQRRSCRSPRLGANPAFTGACRPPRAEPPSPGPTHPRMAQVPPTRREPAHQLLNRLLLPNAAPAGKSPNSSASTPLANHPKTTSGRSDYPEPKLVKASGLEELPPKGWGGGGGGGVLDQRRPLATRASRGRSKAGPFWQPVATFRRFVNRGVPCHWNKTMS